MEYCWPTRTSGEVWLPIAPFTHIYGFLQGVLGPVSARADAVIPERFKPEHVVELMASTASRVRRRAARDLRRRAGRAQPRRRPTCPRCASAPPAARPCRSSCTSAGAGATGREVHEGYGMTEMPAITGTTDLSGVRPGSVGKAIPCNEVQVVDLETGTRVLPPGEKGEVRFRGPHMMTGYRDRPEETAQAIRDGYLHTGDIGHLDSDGFLFATDRKKDVVLVKGFNVFPREVEEAIHTHPEVAAVGVVGVPDERTGGERLVAYVVPRAGAKRRPEPKSRRTSRSGSSATSAPARSRSSNRCR
jgi:long-chain acyl-CoA synthetase